MKKIIWMPLVLVVLTCNLLMSFSHGQVAQLSIVSSKDDAIVLSWVPTSASATLEWADELAGEPAWRPVTEQPVLTNGELRLVLPARQKTSFFRLRFDAPPLAATEFEVSGYELVSSTPISPGLSEETYRADVSNWSDADASVAATVSGVTAEISVIAANLNFGAVPHGATVASSDVFTIRRDSSKPFDSSALAWGIVAKVLPPTTHALITKAVTDGRINSETALLYRVYDDFNDDRLPAAYRGRNDGFPDGVAMLEVERLFPALSPKTQELLGPFRVLPNQPGSWVEVQESLRTAAVMPLQRASSQSARPAAIAPTVQWRTVKTAEGKVRIWWMSELRPGDEARAQAIAAELDRYLWRKLTDLMGEPLTIPNVDGVVRLDIYLTSRLRAETKPLTRFDANGAQICAGDPMPAVILLSPSDTNSDLAHELMHAILHGYKLASCFQPEYRWMHEATATWAEHFAYPGRNAEHGANGRRGAYSFLKDPTFELEFRNDDHEYGAYLWFLFLTRGVSSESPPYVREIWNGAATLSSLNAINAAIQNIGGFKKQWPEFALYNWNRMASAGKPYRHYYEWDKLKQKAKENGPIHLTLNGKSSAIEPIVHYVPHLAADYFHYDFDSDKNIRRIDFKNSVYASAAYPGAKIQAIVKIRGLDWKSAED